MAILAGNVYGLGAPDVWVALIASQVTHHGLLHQRLLPSNLHGRCIDSHWLTGLMVLELTLSLGLLAHLSLINKLFRLSSIRVGQLIESRVSRHDH